MEFITAQKLSQLQHMESLLLVQYTAKWCSPCKTLTPRLEGIGFEYPNVTFVKIDVEDNKDHITELGIRTVPTVMIYRGSELIDQSTGLKPNSYYEEILNKL